MGSFLAKIQKVVLGTVSDASSDGDSHVGYPMSTLPPMDSILLVRSYSGDEFIGILASTDFTNNEFDLRDAFEIFWRQNNFERVERIFQFLGRRIRVWSPSVRHIIHVRRNSHFFRIYRDECERQEVYIIPR